MLKMVAPEATYEQISGQIFQNHDFQVEGRSGDTVRVEGVLGALVRVWRASWTGLDGLGRVSGGS